MLPRSRSIFHIEESASCSSNRSSIRPHAIATTTRSEASATSSSKRTSPGSSNLVGLQLLITQLRSSSGKASAHLVTKHCIKARCAASPQLGLFRTCHLCNKELRPHMDIYVYKGEQGFCSAECREHQMLVEERREFEGSLIRRKQSQKPPHVDAKSKNTIRRKWNDKNMIHAVV